MSGQLQSNNEKPVQEREECIAENCFKKFK